MIHKKYVPFLVFGLVVTVSMALALPIINLNVQKVGEGSTQVVSPFDNGVLNWVLDNNDPRYVVGVSLIADKDLSAGTTIKVLLVDQNNNILAHAEKTLGSNVTAGSQITGFQFNQSVEIKNIDSVVIVATGPTLSS